MKKIAVVLGLVLLTGCASYIPYGSLYTEGKMGVQDNGSSTVPNKEGKACMNSFLSLIATGNASIEEAKRAGNITKVATVDYTVTNVLGIYGEYCTVVKGD